MAGATYFFTVALLDRRTALLLDHIDLLREAVRKAKAARPFHIDAWVVLPEHMHCMWTLPEGDCDYSSRWRDIKIRFARSLPKTEAIRFKPRKRGERGIWQRRFWEHAIRNEDDYRTHFDYIHLNPLKHGLVQHVKDWPYSSFHKFVSMDMYPENWMTDGV